MFENLDAYYHLPKKVKFCKKCVISNQRPSSMPEFYHKPNREGAKYINFNDKGICDACSQAEVKNNIDWSKREKELELLLNNFRKNDGSYDCLVPGSGGKDSVFQSLILKHKYGMNPLTVTWPPILYTDYGYSNFKNWIENGGIDNISFKPNGKIQKLLTKLSIENLLHPFQTFILGQKNLGPKIAKKYGIDLIFYGENEAEYGNPIADNSKSIRDNSYYTFKNANDLYLAGVKINDLLQNHNITLSDLQAYLPIQQKELENTNIQVHYLGYYLKWDPQEMFYYASENVDFKARPFRTQGTYSKYNSIDDKIDDLHYYSTFIKFGIGRATYDASQEIRNKHIDREEALSLVSKFDGEFPDKYFNEVMEYLDIKPSYFHELCNKFRSPHLWKKSGNQWKLRHTANKDGVDD